MLLARLEELRVSILQDPGYAGPWLASRLPGSGWLHRIGGPPSQMSATHVQVTIEAWIHLED